MKEKVEEVLEKIRPMLVRDGGNVELVDVNDEGIVEVKPSVPPTKVKSVIYRSIIKLIGKATGLLFKSEK